MIDFQKARQAFQRYVSQYDANIPSIRMKIIHTYEVMKCSDYLCEQLGLNQEDKNLASLIALLHDIGRFEQWMKYESFADYKTVDHALFSSQLLFDDGLIREFIDDSQYDQIIKVAIEQHNKYQIDQGFDERTLLFIHLIRDADKLDNFRVKDEEDIETTLYVSLTQVNQETISPAIYDQFYHQKLIYGPTRQTHLDMWLSYIAFIFDLHFSVSLKYIREHDWVNRSFDRLNPQDEKTHQQYEILRQKAIDYIH
jgi:HD superfamily phosphohydrolase YqeK